MRGKVIATAVLAILSLALTGCGGNAGTGSSGLDAQADTVSASDINLVECSIYSADFLIPDDWIEVTDDDDPEQSNSRTFESDYGARLYAWGDNPGYKDVDINQYMVDYSNQLEEDLQVHLDEQMTVYSTGTSYGYIMSYTRKNGDAFNMGKCVMIASGTYIYGVMADVPGTSWENLNGIIDEIANSLHALNPLPPFFATLPEQEEQASNEPEGSAQSGDENQSDGQTADAAPAATVSEGTYRVGTDIQAGEYKLTAQAGTSGYWEVTASSSPDASIIGNDNFENSAYVTVTDGQYLTLRRCTGKLL